MAFGKIVGFLAEALFRTAMASLERRNESADSSSDSMWAAVKLVHAEDLQQWDHFKEYREHSSISYADYRAGAERIRALKREISYMTTARFHSDPPRRRKGLRCNGLSII